MTQRSGVHRARAALLATALTILTLAGHTAGQGSLTTSSVALVALLSTGLGLAATRRPLTWSRALLVLLAGQALLHMVMTFTAGHGHASAGTDVFVMVVGHMAAAAIAAGVLMHADSILARWSAFIATTVGAVALVLAEPTPVASSALPSPEGSRESRDALRHGVVRRGPPARSVALLI